MVCLFLSEKNWTEQQLVCRNWTWSRGWPIWISNVLCATIEKRWTTGGKTIPLKLKNHFLILNISINALPYLALGGKKELENGSFCPIFSYPFSFLVACLGPTFPRTFSHNDKPSFWVFILLGLGPSAFLSSGVSFSLYVIDSYEEKNTVCIEVEINFTFREETIA